MDNYSIWPHTAHFSQATFVRLARNSGFRIAHKDTGSGFDFPHSKGESVHDELKRAERLAQEFELAFELGITYQAQVFQYLLGICPMPKAPSWEIIKANPNDENPLIQLTIPQCLNSDHGIRDPRSEQLGLDVHAAVSTEKLNVKFGKLCAALERAFYDGRNLRIEEIITQLRGDSLQPRTTLGELFNAVDEHTVKINSLDDKTYDLP